MLFTEPGITLIAGLVIDRARKMLLYDTTVLILEQISDSRDLSHAMVGLR